MYLDLFQSLFGSLSRPLDLCRLESNFELNVFFEVDVLHLHVLPITMCSHSRQFISVRSLAWLHMQGIALRSTCVLSYACLPCGALIHACALIWAVSRACAVYVCSLEVVLSYGCSHTRALLCVLPGVGSPRYASAPYVLSALMCHRSSLRVAWRGYIQVPFFLCN